MEISIHFATNRDPHSRPRLGFGKTFNPVHPHELRFGRFTIDAGKPGSKGTDLADRLSAAIAASEGKLEVFAEDLKKDPPLLGSNRLFAELKTRMDAGEDTLIFIHGYNTTFEEALGTGLALQARLRARSVKLNVVVFTWPSDGKKTPFVAYKSDRDDAAASGLAFSRAFRKLNDFLRAITRDQSCRGKLHLACHSMGNFVLENTLWHLRKNIAGTLPRIFTEVLLLSADVDHDAFEHENKLSRLPELARRISVFFNRGDEALSISDITKGNPERLGQSGPKHPLDVPAGVVNVDCSEVVGGFVEHSYFLDEALSDVAAVLRGLQDDRIPKRDYLQSANAYRLVA